MKIVTYIISVIALAIGVFNVTKIDFVAPMSKQSFPALITTISAGCAILIVSLIRISLKIKDLVK
tara:strand:+ start:541 stop:735 length:195 start_codon:yes stop_codon:yes gene_type:complete